MLPLTDQHLAQRLLQRKGGGSTLRRFIHTNRKRYAVGTAALAGAAFMIHRSTLAGPAWFATGCILGTWLRDVQWVLATDRLWPFTEKVTDWGKVESIAGDKA
jgi:hypothetical protein